MLKRLQFVALLALVLVTAAGLQAQTISLEDQLNMKAPTFTGESGLFQTLTGDTIKKGDWSFGIYYNKFNYLAAPAPELAPPSAREFRNMEVAYDNLSASLGYGITDKWEISASLPYVTMTQNAGDLAGYVNGYPYVGKFTENDLGNVHLATKYALFGGDNPNKFAVTGFYDINSGNPDTGISTGHPDLGFGVAYTRSIYNFDVIYVNKGDRDADNTPELVAFNLPNEIRADIGVNIPLRTWSATNWITEVNTIWYDGGQNSPDDVISVQTGLRHWFGTSGWGASADVRANTSLWANDSNGEYVGGMIGVHYTPQHLVSMVPPPPAPVVVPPPPPPPEPAPVVVPPPEPVAPPRGPQELRSDEVLFDAGSARLTNIAKALLDDIGLRMKQEPTTTASVSGYTDGKEKTGKAKDLDKRRAEADRDYLVSRHGIDASRITVEAKGADTEAANPRHATVKLILP